MDFTELSVLLLGSIFFFQLYLYKKNTIPKYTQALRISVNEVLE